MNDKTINGVTASGTHKGSNSHDMRMSNIGLIIKLLSRKKICSRVELAKTLGLTQATITYIVRELIDCGLIVESGTMESASKRPTIGLRINNRFCTVSLLIERTLARIALVGADGEIIVKKTVSFGFSAPPENVLGLIKNTISDYLRIYSNQKNIIGIGIAVPGPYIPEKSRIELMSGVHGWENIALDREFSGFGVPVYIEHNANCGALAELWYNERNNERNIMYVLAGYGIGAGLIVDGKLYKGKIGTSGEIGHLSIDINGPLCECGNRGCLELYCSVKRIAENYNRKKEGKTLTAEEVLRLAELGDKDAQSAVDPVIRYLAMGFAGLTNVLGEEVIVLAGTLSEAETYVIPRLEAQMKKYLLKSIANSVSIRPGRSKDDIAVLIGASANVIDNILLQRSFKELLGCIGESRCLPV